MVSTNPMVSKAILDARALAAVFGGRALTGSAKQKAWGEQIRAEKLKGINLPFYERDELTDEQAILACSPSGLGRSAHFWIANRNRKPREIGAFFEQQKYLLALAESLRESTDEVEFKTACAQYNALTEAWGFTE